MTPTDKLDAPMAELDPTKILGQQNRVSRTEQSDFRDRLATADKQGNRKWIYPKKPNGRWYRRRTYVSWALLTIMFTGPFVKINGNPLLLFNIIERRFSILGQLFWPQDMVIFAVAMLLFLTSIIVFTSAFGRLWCGWTCPQTLLMEMVFRKIEYFIEGDAAQQKILNTAPWNKTKILKKASKHVIFLALSLLIGNTLLSYIIGIEQLKGIVTDDPRRHLTGLGFMLGFTAIFYLIFSRFREQACTFICPYGRFQSTIIDENTMVVAYDHKRGEKRSPLHRAQSDAARTAEGFRDCVSCRQCVVVCPTGIDIRNGTQMECVNCTACIDACDTVMTKIGKPEGLIRYASLNTIERGERFKFTARLGWYSALLFVLAAVLAILVFNRSDVETTFLRAPGSLFQQTAPGKIQNLYTIKVINKTTREIPIRFSLENSPGRLQVMGGDVIVPKAGLVQAPILIELDEAALKGAKTKLKIGIYASQKRIQIIETAFIGPRNNKEN
jgi:cytochrome c oxidase accessory protein FixG